MDDDHRITAGTETLFKQTGWTALEYMVSAVKNIDGYFGDGYAREHPELIGQYMLTCAIDLHAGVVARAIESVGREVEDVADQLSTISGQLENSFPSGEPS